MTKKKTSKKVSKAEAVDTVNQTTAIVETTQQQLDDAEKAMILGQQTVQDAIEAIQKNVTESYSETANSVQQALKDQQEVVENIVKEAQEITSR